MGLIQTAESIEGHVRDAYAALQSNGASLPEKRNLANLAPTIRGEFGGLGGLKRALAVGTAQVEFPVGTELTDEYDGNDSPLIVAQYLDSSNNSSYGDAVGALLVRKFVEPASQAYGFVGTEQGWRGYDSLTSAIFLAGTYLDRCSDSIKEVISEISIPTYTTTGSSSATVKWFIMSARELGSGRNIGNNSTLGFLWEYWAQQLGRTDYEGTGGSGLVGRTRSGTATPYWTRSPAASDAEVAIDTGGLYSHFLSATGVGLRPACFISA